MRDIRTAHGTPAERRTAEALHRLTDRYELDDWIFTERVDVDEYADPHSHPVLTLDTGHSSERLLLAALVHEQLHWFERSRAPQRCEAVEATRGPYPQVPGPRAEGGAGDELATRAHLLVCLLEFRALKLLLGRREGRETILERAALRYAWVYRTVLRDERILWALLVRNGLVPDGLRRMDGRDHPGHPGLLH